MFSTDAIFSSIFDLQLVKFTDVEQMNMEDQLCISLLRHNRMPQAWGLKQQKFFSCNSGSWNFKNLEVINPIPHNRKNSEQTENQVRFLALSENCGCRKKLQPNPQNKRQISEYGESQLK
jgi:hypothetical protein